LAAPLADAPRVATVLGAFVQALHRPAPHDAPRSPWRGVPLDARTQTFREHLARLGPIVDDVAARRLWDRAAASPPWRGSPLWIHGDLHPGNLLIDADRICAVIDFGDLAAGDPATDLSIAWMLFAPSIRPLFLSAARGPFDPIDADTVMRARGWALALGLAYLARSRDDPALHALGLATVEAALTGTDTPHWIAPM
jgi:aminoglycoside phosphotransferase (APT) family kinase protein